MDCRDTQNQCTGLLPAAQQYLATGRLDSQLVIYGQSFDRFHKEHEGLIISFILKALSNFRQVKYALNPLGKW